MTAVREYPDRSRLMAALAEQVAAELTLAIDAKGWASLAVPGGTTPGPFFEALRRHALNWSAVTILPTDERCVAESSERSNARLIRETLLQDQAAEARFLPLYRDGAAPDRRHAEVTEEVAALLPLDICILGMGEDRHTASLFPGADVLDQALSDTAPPVLPIQAATAGEPRLTLTAPVLRSARHIHLLILGPAKKAALELALVPGPVQDAPVRSILTSECPTQIHYAD